MSERSGKVYLVGAGPGAVDLITLRGAEILARAEVVVYDSLVNPGLLRLAPATAEMIHAGKRGGTRPEMKQSEIEALLVERARAGSTVVRLKGGDPFVFGRGGEEAEALTRAGIEFEAVPGVTSALAAPAFAGIPLTHRERGSFVAFVTGHEGDGRQGGSRVPWAELARAAKGRGTLVLLMATARLGEVLGELEKGGLAPETPAAAIQWATLADQKTVSGTLATLAAEASRAALGAPAVIVVGECAALREHLKWVERMPLFGRRIVITRAGDRASSFARELRMLGAETVEFPTIETTAPDSYAVLDDALSRLGSFDWVIFTSATGVDSFIERLRTLGRDLRTLGAARIGAIGPATAKRLRAHALTVDAMPSEYRAEAIIGAIGAERVRDARILIPRAQVAREVLPAMLREAGAREVVVAPAYKTVRPSGPALARIRERLSLQGFDLVAFTSSSTVANFVAIAGSPAPGTKAAVIGPITGETAKEHGFEVAVRAREYTIAGLVSAITEYFARRAAGGP
jgi:uroporphyrinogen III methyltransferase/synthase